MSRKYKRNRNGVDYKRLSIYLPKELAAKVKAESEGRLESQNMVIKRLLLVFSGAVMRWWKVLWIVLMARVRLSCAVCEMMCLLNHLLGRTRHE